MRLFSYAFSITWVVFLTPFFSLHAQDTTPVVNRSNTVQLINGNEYYFHAVLQGQTLFSIARAYDVEIEDILGENPELNNSDDLRYDQIIRIPANSSSQQDSPPKDEPQRETVTEIQYHDHQVRRRETVYGISRMYGISEKELLEHNPEIRSGLRTNMIVRIPREVERVIHYVEYTVPPQQTLFSISREYNVPIEDIEALNPQLSEGLKAGQTIRIPVKSDTKTRPPFVAEEPEKYPDVKDKPTLKEDPWCDEPQLKEHYNVALLIPLYLDKLEKDPQDTIGRFEKPEMDFTFFEYYEGLLIALDSVRKRGADIRLNVYDVCDSLLKARSVLAKPELREMDLIIGPFYQEIFELAADYAKRRDIPIVSPLHWENPQWLEEYPNMFQVMPHIETQVNDMANYIAEQYPEDNIVLVHNNQPGVIDLITGYKNTLNQALNRYHYFKDSVNLARIDGYFFNGVYVGERISNVYVLNDSLLEQGQGAGGNLSLNYEAYSRRNNIQENVFGTDGMEVMKEQLDSSRRNVVVSLMGGEALVSELTRQLNNVRDTFEVVLFGVPQWRDYRLEYRYLQNLNTHLFSPGYIDYNKQHHIDFIRRFRKENQTEPGVMGFKAMETGMYFFTALMQYGQQFRRCIPQANRQPGRATPLWFERPYEEGGWENKQVYIYKYENYDLKNVRDTKRDLMSQKD